MRRRRPLLLLLGALLLAGLAAGAALLLLGGPNLPSRSPERPEAEVHAARRLEPSQVRLSTSPPGARIALDGRSLEARTPDLFEVTARERHLFEVELEGYRTAMTELVLEPGEVRELHIELSPER